MLNFKVFEIFCHQMRFLTDDIFIRRFNRISCYLKKWDRCNKLEFLNYGDMCALESLLAKIIIQLNGGHLCRSFYEIHLRSVTLP